MIIIFLHIFKIKFSFISSKAGICSFCLSMLVAQFMVTTSSYLPKYLSLYADVIEVPLELDL